VRLRLVLVSGMFSTVMRCVLLWLVLIGCLAAAGCTAARRGKAPSSSSPAARTAAGAREGRNEYSAAAIERRVEAQARYAAALLHDFNEEPEAATEDFRKAALADLDNEALVLEVSARLLRFKQHAPAIDLLQQAAARPEASGLIDAQLGLACALAGKKDEAIAANRVAIKKSPEAILGYRNLAQLYLQDRQMQEGLNVLDQAAEQANPDGHFLVELGELYLAFANPGTNDVARAKALAIMNRAAKMDLTHPLVLLRLGDGFAELGKMDAAAEIYLKILERYPNLPGLREKLAEVFLRNRQGPQAAAQLQAILRNRPTDFRPYFLLGSIEYEENKMPEAAEHFTKALLLNPDFEPAYYELAGAQLGLKQTAEALATLGKARAKFKPSFVCEYLTAVAYTGLKQYTNAIRNFLAAEVIARVTETNRLTHVLYFQIGAAYERNQQFDEAERAFKQCLERSPDFAEALNYLGYMWADRNVNLAEARAMIEKAVKLEPKNAAFLDSLGWVLYRLGQPREALKYLQQSIENSKEPDSTLYDHLGDIYHTLQQPDQAREAWRKSLAIEPNEDKAKIQKKLDGTSAPAPTRAPGAK
jgi:tetratricopeptide (TPR) repeat protein